MTDQELLPCNLFPKTKVYTVGLYSIETLLCNNFFITYIHKLDTNSTMQLECDLQHREMSMKKWNTSSFSYEFILPKDMHWGIIDLKNNGTRWEGFTYNNKPCGYGCFYDHNNKRRFAGFIFEKKRYCFGEEYYDNECVYYRGTYVNDKRHGWGYLFDKNGDVIYEGDWYFGNQQQMTIILNDVTINQISDGIENLVISKNIHDSILSFTHYSRLKSLKFQEDSLKELTDLTIDHCDSLKSIVFGFNCFTKCGEYILDADDLSYNLMYENMSIEDVCITISNCAVLNEVLFHDCAFGDAAGSLTFRSVI